VTLTIELILNASLLSLLGGLGSYLHGCRESRFARSWTNAITEIVLALVVGFVVMYCGVWQGWPPALTCVLILVFSNNGGDSLIWLKGLVSKVVASRLKINSVGKDNE
jgi:hypothetical protein